MNRLVWLYIFVGAWIFSVSSTGATRRFVLAQPGEVNAKQLVGWKQEQIAGVVVVLDEALDAGAIQTVRQAVATAGMDLFYWIEVGRNPKLAEAHPEWMASFGMHMDWTNRFPKVKPPGEGEVAKVHPWVPIRYRAAFEAHVKRVETLLALAGNDYRGLLLNDLQGGPASCGCGNTLCRWATDYDVAATGGEALPAESAAADFVAAVAAKAKGKEIVPVWLTECEDVDLPASRRKGEWTTSLCGSVGCSVGTCPKAYSKQFSTLAEKHTGPLGILALHRELERTAPGHGAAGGWVGGALRYALDIPAKQSGGAVIAPKRLWTVVQGYDVTSSEEKSAIEKAEQFGSGVVVIARTRVEQSFTPKIMRAK